MANKKSITAEQELRAALAELAKTVRAAIESGRQFSFSSAAQEWAIPSSEIVAMSDRLRAAEALLKKENT